MTKANMKARLLAEKATFVEETGRYTLSQKKFDKIIEWLNETTENFKVVQKKGTENVFGIKSKDGKTVFAIVEVVNKTRTKDTTKKEKDPEIGTRGHKVKGGNYIVMYKGKQDEEESCIDTMTTCREIKDWLKTISRRQMEYLRIYDENKNEVRKSAWVG